jgi:hypothetical protein
MDFSAGNQCMYQFIIFPLCLSLKTFQYCSVLHNINQATSLRLSPPVINQSTFLLSFYEST